MSFKTISQKVLLTVIKEALIRAGKILYSDFSRNIPFTLKTDSTPVSDTDLKINHLIIRYIKQRFPHHAIYSEEGENSTSKSDYSWFIDPIDGTSNFIRHVPIFTISLAALYRGQPLVSGIYIPLPQSQLFLAYYGHGAFVNGKPLHIVEGKNYQNYLLLERGVEISDLHLCQKVMAVLPSAQSKVRILGSTSYSACLVATGKADALITVGCKLHDVVPGMLLNQEAKGVTTDFHGNIICDKLPPKLYAVLSSKNVHSSLLNSLQILI